MELSKLNLITNLRLPSLLAGWLLYSSSFSFADRVTVNGIEQVASGGISVETDPIYTNGILNYYTKGESDGRYATGTPLYVYGETDTLQQIVERGNFSSRDILPLTPTNSLGSFAYPWQDVYISTSSIFLGTATKIFDSTGRVALLQRNFEIATTNGTFATDINGWSGGVTWDSTYQAALLPPNDLGGDLLNQANPAVPFPNNPDTFRISIDYLLTNSAGVSGGFFSISFVQFNIEPLGIIQVPIYQQTGKVVVVTSFAVNSGLNDFDLFWTPGSEAPTEPVYITEILVERMITNSTSELSTSGGVFQVTSPNGMSINGVTQPILRTATSNFSWSAIAAGERVTQTVTIAGCKVGDGVSVTPATIQPPALRWSAQIFSTNTVSLFVRNDDLLATSTPSNGNWRVEVRSY